MDWLIEWWPLLVVLFAACIAAGRHEAKASGQQRQIDELRARIAAFEAAHAVFQRDIAAAIEGIRIQLARIETTLAEMRRSA